MTEFTISPFGVATHALSHDEVFAQGVEHSVDNPFGEALLLAVRCAGHGLVFEANREANSAKLTVFHASVFRVPSQNQHVVGMTQVDGQIVPVFSLLRVKRELSLDSSQLPLLAIEHEKRKILLLLDSPPWVPGRLQLSDQPVPHLFSHFVSQGFNDANADLGISRLFSVNPSNLIDYLAGSMSV
jgi:hypothetical protein